MGSRTVIHCACLASLLVLVVLAEAASQENGMPVRPSRFRSTQEVIQYLQALSAYMNRPRPQPERPVRPAKFNNLAEYSRYLGALNNYMANVRRTRIGRSVPGSDDI